ncbi:EspA/EspE family type VII secretion system effector [Mycolicibacterium hodleri]|uniref:ESX-1 secretion-associated protein EspA/EspE-like domain-containing protein n=1 Tax=Mycolicibacterium hodleri TaxID=49897 RepID=A0A502DZK6_9MYCO|nr:EspA/EspE family type VII secretion system effector [Mycolicibacterium hodleri]TPG29711.1 hypothetical protein EAH80_26120 [Mycolicibacterium hodleri]
MGLLDDLGKMLDAVEAPTPFDVINGVRGAWTDVPNLAKDLVEGNFHSALNDGRNVIGDANDVVQGLASLGLNMGGVPGAFANSKVTKLAESKVLSAAQLAIEVLKKSTGSGDPYPGDEFRSSSQRLSKVTDTLIAAGPHTDRWDGTASQVYNAVNASHRRCASGVSAADEAVAKVLDLEADQITRSRQTIDETSRNLTDYDLATCWMNATPPTAAIKFTMDVAAAGAAMATVNATLAILLTNSAENALRIVEQVSAYENAGADTSGNPQGGCDIFSVPDGAHPLARPDVATPLPDPADGTQAPSRSQPNTPHTVPSPEVLPTPTPATPYGTPAPAPR